MRPSLSWRLTPVAGGAELRLSGLASGRYIDLPADGGQVVRNLPESRCPYPPPNH